MLNRTVLMGRLVADPELKTTQTNTSVTTFRIAVDRSYTKKGEERQADFFDVVAWRYTAEFICKHFRKGSLIAIDGQLQSRTYQAKDGTNRYVVEVIADNASFTGERNNGNYTPSSTGVGTYGGTDVRQPEPYTAQTSDFEEFEDSGDLPF